MFKFDLLSPEEKYKYGSWVYAREEGWRDPDWWDKHMELAEATGHVMKVTIVRFTPP